MTNNRCEHDTDKNYWDKHPEDPGMTFAWKATHKDCPFCAEKPKHEFECFPDCGCQPKEKLSAESIADDIITEMHNLTPSTRARAKDAIIRAIEKSSSDISITTKAYTAMMQLIGYAESASNLLVEIYGIKNETLTIRRAWLEGLIEKVNKLDEAINKERQDHARD